MWDPIYIIVYDMICYDIILYNKLHVSNHDKNQVKL